jgi:hypothetical protein
MGEGEEVGVDLLEDRAEQLAARDADVEGAT